MSVMHSCHNVIGWCLFAPHESHGLLSAGSWLKLSFCTCCALVSMEIRGWLSWTPWVFLIDQLWLWIICFEPHYGVKEPLWEGLTNVRIKTTGPFSLSAVMTGEKIRICNQQNLIHSLQEKHYRCIIQSVSERGLNTRRYMHFPGLKPCIAALFALVTIVMRTQFSLWDTQHVTSYPSTEACEPALRWNWNLMERLQR